MSCGVGCRRGSDPELLWLWRRPVATAPIQPLAWEPPYAAGAAPRNSNNNNNNKKKQQQQKRQKTKKKIYNCKENWDGKSLSKKNTVGEIILPKFRTYSTIAINQAMWYGNRTECS